MDAMTQYGVEGAKRSFVESEDEQEQRANLGSYCGAVTMLVRGRLDETAKETAETKGELSREDTWHDICVSMQDLHEDGPQL